MKTINSDKELKKNIESAMDKISNSDSQVIYFNYGNLYYTISKKEDFEIDISQKNGAIEKIVYSNKINGSIDELIKDIKITFYYKINKEEFKEEPRRVKPHGYTRTPNFRQRKY